MKKQSKNNELKIRWIDQQENESIREFVEQQKYYNQLISRLEYIMKISGLPPEAFGK